ncbi:hypothetical protein D9619_011428 [Psilocybe cf. subviscida]|uniref:Uncharacterized protein n=1 Tax=Psilocybe cf. subviscida TaxID=2480587 RepID=A0A8H5BJF7_9AGAR|nr:hypothetical protein D9619_011428 [Psilocybe cf. subviscida]
MSSALLQDLVKVPMRPNETLPTSTKGIVLEKGAHMIPAQSCHTRRPHQRTTGPASLASSSPSSKARSISSPSSGTTCTTSFCPHPLKKLGTSSLNADGGLDLVIENYTLQNPQHVPKHWHHERPQVLPVERDQQQQQPHMDQARVEASAGGSGGCGVATIELVTAIPEHNHSSTFKLHAIRVEVDILKFAIYDFNHDFLYKTPTYRVLLTDLAQSTFKPAIHQQQPPARLEFLAHTYASTSLPTSAASSHSCPIIHEVDEILCKQRQHPPTLLYAHPLAPTRDDRTTRGRILPAAQAHTFHADAALLGLSLAEIVDGAEQTTDRDQDPDRAGPSTHATRVYRAPNCLSDMLVPPIEGFVPLCLDSDVEESQPNSIHSDMSSENGQGARAAVLGVPINVNDTVNAPGRPTTIGHSARSDFDAPHLSTSS